MVSNKKKNLMMHKVTQSERNITPFGGLNFLYDAFEKAGISQFIDSELGTRNYRATYSYSDIVLSLFGNCMCNGEFISDLELLKEKYASQLFDAIPSADTVEYVCQELKVENEIIKTDQNIEHQINKNKKLNKALVNLCVYNQQLTSQEKNYVLDYDNVVVPTEKQDAKKSYKKTYGYHPGIAFVNDLPVHIENRNGNTPARYGQKDLLSECFDNLKSRDITIAKYRGDSASYQKNVVDFLEEKNCIFYIRNVNSGSFATHCSQSQSWEEVEINYQKKEVTSIEYKPFGGQNAYRVVVTRTLRADKQLDIFSGQPYTYYGIITTDITSTNKEVILFYNQRGNDSENNNKNLLNDFNLNRLPFMDMDTNTAYMGLMALCNVLFGYAKKILVHNDVEGISIKDRVKKVCFRYISVCTSIVKNARKSIIKVFSVKKYKTLELVI